ncbi:hypothetical protein EG834_20055, partial [bacterium]|nr:hypothetical protein [bacterium]
MKPKFIGSRLIWLFLLVVLIVLAGAMLALAFQPFTVWQSLGGRLAPDGDLEVLTPGLYQVLQKAFLYSGIVFLILGIGMALKPAASKELLYRFGRSIQSLARRLPADVRTFFSQLSHWPPKHIDR